MAPAPNRFHQKLVTTLARLLGNWVNEHDAGDLYVAPFDVKLTEVDVYQPDLSFFATDRLHVLTDAGADGPPSLVVEVLSPRTAAYDRDVKRDIYARTGVDELWLVDPDARTVAIYRLQDDATTPVATMGTGAELTTPLLDGLVLAVDDVFED